LRELPSVSGGDPKGSHGPGRARGMGERLWAGMWRVASPCTCSTWSQMSFKASVFEEPIAAQGSEHPADARGLASDPRTGGHADAPDVSGQRYALERELSRKAAAHACRRITTDAYLLGHERISRRNGPTRASERHWCGRSTAASSWRRHASTGGLTEEAKANGLTVALPRNVALAPGENRAQGSHTGPLRVVNFESYESRFPIVGWTEPGPGSATRFARLSSGLASDRGC
jgi:hypothetical protein